MMNQEVSIYKFSVKYGIIVAAIPIVFNTILVVFDLLMQYYGDDLGGPLRVPTYFIFLPIAICIAIYQYKKRKEGRLKLKEALIIGLEIALIVAFLVVVYDVLFNTILAPSFFEDYYEVYGEELFKEFVACCDYTIEQFEHHKRLRIEYWKYSYGNIIVFLIIGLITATIAGLIMKTKRKKK